MSKSEIDKIKSVLAEINEAIVLKPITIQNLTKSLEIAVEALEYFDYDELYNGSVNRTDKTSHAEYAESILKQISEILEDK